MLYQAICILFLFCATFGEKAELFSYRYNEEKLRQAADYLLSGLNKSIEPCENFFQQVCSNNAWKPDGSYDSIWSQHSKEYFKAATSLIKAINVSGPSSKYIQNTRTYFEKCMEMYEKPDWKVHLNEARMKNLGLRQPEAMLVDAGNGSDAQSDKEKAWRLIGLIEDERKPGFFLNYVFTEGPISVISVNGTRIPAICEMKNLSQFINYAIGTINSIGQSGNLTSDLHDRVIDLCSVFTEKDAPTEYDPVEIVFESVASSYPNFLLDQFLEGLIPPNLIQGFKNRTKLHIHRGDLQRLDKYGQAFEKAGIDAVRFLVFMTLLEFDPVGNYTAEQFCTGRAMTQYPPVILRLYMDHFGRNATEIRLEVLQLVRNIFSAFRFLLNTVEWLELDDRERVTKKVDSLKVNPGIPEWLYDEAEMTRRAPDYDSNHNVFENDFIGRKHRLNYIFQRIADGIPLDEPYLIPETIYPDLDIGAYYYDLYNYTKTGGLTVKAPTSFPPIFDVGYPIAIKYGRLGSIVAHELMHAFDSKRINSVLSDGRPPLKEETARKYDEEKTCLEREYSKFCTPDRAYCISGEKTSDENMADVAGLKVAYLAYKFLTQLHGYDPQLPGLHNYTNDQLFFMSHAKFWCERGYNRAAFQSGRAPNVARVDVAYRHVPPFASAFNCPVGSKYNPEKKCNSWGDISHIVKHKFEPPTHR